MKNFIGARDCILGMYDGSDFSSQEISEGKKYMITAEIEAEYEIFDGKYIVFVNKYGMEIYLKPDQIKGIEEIEEWNK